MLKPKIKKITALEILDSRGNPTVRVFVKLSNGITASASVPSGASTGKHEALELRDGDKKRYGGKGVLQAVFNVNKIIAPKLLEMDVRKQEIIDQILVDFDGTENKSKLGVNATLGVSLAVCKAAAQAQRMALYRYIRQVFKLPYRSWVLPAPTMNIINGGAHAGWSLDIQEFMIVPLQKHLPDKIRAGAEIFQTLGKLLSNKGYPTLKGDEGGYAPKLNGNEEAFKVIVDAIKKAGYKPGVNVKIAIDAAASEFYNSKSQQYKLKADGKVLSADELMKLEIDWVKKYPICSIEDGLAEDDWENWKKLTKMLGKKIKLVGDDLFVTNTDRLMDGIDQKVANTILIKPNQIGTLTETIDAIELAHEHGYQTSISHRSGETNDTFIADLAVAVNSEFIKTGSLSRSERVEKYNRLLEINQELNYGI